MDNGLQCIEALRLDNVGVADALADRVDQRLPEQRMIVGDDECVFCAQARPPITSSWWATRLPQNSSGN
jgi:hypothetical protein